jgi:anhydro-N-acetylmuramic acid kinase
MGTLQLGEPAWVAERTGSPVVSDLRSRDVAAGGHGTPLASLFDALLLGGGSGTRAALNLGGIANITIAFEVREPVVATATTAKAAFERRGGAV